MIHLIYTHLCAFVRIAETERQWEAKMKESLARKEGRIKAIRYERDKMIAQVSSWIQVVKFFYFTTFLCHYKQVDYEVVQI